MNHATVAAEDLSELTQSSSLRVVLVVALVSFASLLLELALTRLFSVVLFYHFAFFAISVALLGLGSGGVFAHLQSGWLQSLALEKLGRRICVINSVMILAALEIVLHTLVTLRVSGHNFVRLTVIYLACGVPFFFTGLLFSVLFARSGAVISRLYGADLLGGSLACLAAVPLLNSVGAPNALLFASLTMAFAGALWSDRFHWRSPAVWLAVLFALLMAANHSGRLIDVIYAKGTFRDPKWIEFARWNAISRIEVDNQNGFRNVVIDADASTAIMNVDPAHWDQDQPVRGSQPFSGAPAQQVFNWKKSLMAAAPAIANVLRPHGDFAIIGPGGGVDVLRAVANGSPSVTAIEINPTIANDVMRGRYADYAYLLYERPQVHVHVQDGRSYIRSSKDRYDALEMTLVDTWASTAAGAFALSENNLYTLEAFREYFDHLRPDGIIAITRWEFREPREALRVVSEAMAALQQLGVRDCRQHFIVVADGSLNEDGHPVLVVAKKSALTDSEYSAVAQHVRANPNLVWLNPPAEYAAASPLSPAGEVYERLINSNDPRTFARKYAYNIAPVTDNDPFFFFTMKTGYMLRNYFHERHGIDWKVNVGVVTLGMVLVISVVAVLAFLILPLALRRRVSGPKTSLLALLYFIAVGLGYITVEISLIQRFVLFLGHPTYALTVVVFLLLISSGLGSVAGRRLLTGPSPLRLLLAAIVALITLYVFGLPALLSASVGLPFWLKLLMSTVVLAPLGFLMGMPFPTVLAQVDTVEWAWALNAAASVLGSVAAMVIAIHFGLTATLAVAAVAYGIAAVCTRVWSAGDWAMHSSG
jgi:spermidine synthase/MFS family permease